MLSQFSNQHVPKRRSDLGTFAEFQQDWTQLKGGCNWYTFRFFVVEFEWDKMFGGVELTLMFFGVGICVRHSYAETDDMIRISQAIAEINSTSEEKAQ